MYKFSVRQYQELYRKFDKRFLVHIQYSIN